MTTILTSFAELTLGMSAVITVLLLTLLAFGKKLTAKSRYLIWSLVIIRLAIPFSLQLLPPMLTLPSVPSTEVTIPVKPEVPSGTEVNKDEKLPQNDVGAPMTDVGNVSLKEPVSTEGVAGNPVVPDEGDVPQGNISVIPDTPAETGGVISGNVTVPDTERPHTVPDKTEPAPETPAADNGVKIDVAAVLSAIWLAGAAVFALVSIISYVRYTRRVLKTSSPAEEETVAVYERLCQELGVNKSPRLLVSNTTDSPAAFGYFRRYIVLPEIPLSLNSLELTLSHELTHVKRGDLCIKLLSVLARSFHWFNPLVHYAAYKCETECELSCDEAVLSDRDDEIRTEYGETLVDILKFCRRRRGSLTTHFSPDKKAVKARLGNILYGTGKRRGIVLVALCLALCIVAGTAIGCSFGTGEGTEPATDTETEETSGAESESTPDTEDTSDTDPAPEEVKSAFTVLPGSRENVSLYENVIYYDAYTGKHIMCVLLVAERDVENFSVTRLTWSEELLVESEEITHIIGDLKAGAAVMLNVDTVEIVGYTGISYEVDGKVFRAFPAMSGMDGTPYLMDIEDQLSPEFNKTDYVTIPVKKRAYTWVDDGTASGTYTTVMTDRSCTLRYKRNAEYIVNAVMAKVEGKLYAEQLAQVATNGYGTMHGYRVTEEMTNSAEYPYITSMTALKSSIDEPLISEMESRGEHDEIERLQRKYAFIIDFGTEGEYLILSVTPVDIKKTPAENDEKAVIMLAGSAYLTWWESDEPSVEQTGNGSVMPDESYAGTWTLYSTYNYDYVKIGEITADSMKFRGNIYKYYTFSGTAVLKDGEWVFGDGISTDYMGPDGITGRLQFTDDSVSIIYDSGVKYDEHYIRAPVIRIRLPSIYRGIPSLTESMLVQHCNV